METIHLFFASSNELCDVRKIISEYIIQKSRSHEPRGIHIQLDKWEYLSSAIPRSGRDQDEFNMLLSQANIVAVVIKNKVGKYTQEEFETALNLFRITGKPKICVYKMPPDKPEPSLDNFLKELRSGGTYGLDHFPVSVDTVEQLWIEISKELDIIITNLHSIKNNPSESNGNDRKPFTVIGRQINMNGGTYNENRTNK